MASNFIEFNVGLPVVDRNKPPQQQIDGLRDYIKGVVDQLRYEFRHINIKALEAGKIQGILGVNQGGTGAATADVARANLGIPEYTVDSAAEDNISVSAGSYTSNVDIDATKSGYKVIGVVGFHITNASNNGSGYTNCSYFYCFKKDDNTVRVRIRNHGTGAAKVKATVYVLYQSS